MTLSLRHIGVSLALAVWALATPALLGHGVDAMETDHSFVGLENNAKEADPDSELAIFVLYRWRIFERPRQQTKIHKTNSFPFSSDVFHDVRGPPAILV